MMEDVKHLLYPAYFFTILGVWKLLGVIAILSPKLPLLKEWAYAGFVFDTTGALASHVAVGDGLADWFPAVAVTVLVYVSWRLRPPSRRV